MKGILSPLIPSIYDQTFYLKSYVFICIPMTFLDKFKKRIMFTSFNFFFLLTRVKLIEKSYK